MHSRSSFRSLLLSFAVLASLFSASEKALAQENGRFVYADLLTSDARKSQEFYGGLFGWSFNRLDSPTGQNEFSIVAGGDEIGLAIDIGGEPESADETQWISVFAVEEVDDALGLVQREGGSIVATSDVTFLGGSYALVRDPTDALLALYSDAMPTPHNVRQDRWIWFDLFTDDITKSENFYRGLARASIVVTDEVSGQADKVLIRDGYPIAGFVEIKETTLAAAWLPYVGVSNIDDRISRARQLGGVLLVRNNVAAIIIDPVGAAIGLHQVPEEGRR